MTLARSAKAPEAAASEHRDVVDSSPAPASDALAEVFPMAVPGIALPAAAGPAGGRRLSSASGDPDPESGSAGRPRLAALRRMAAAQPARPTVPPGGPRLAALRRMAAAQPGRPSVPAEPTAGLVLRRKGNRKLMQAISGTERQPALAARGGASSSGVQETARTTDQPHPALAELMAAIEQYDHAEDSRPAQQLAMLDQIRLLLNRYVPANLYDESVMQHRRTIVDAVRAELGTVEAQVARLDRVTAGQDAPYQMMTDEGGLWRDPDWQHGRPKLNLTGKEYFVRLSGLNKEQLAEEARKIAGDWAEGVRRRLTEALENAVVSHYTTRSRAEKIRDGGRLKAKTVLEKEEPAYQHNTSDYDDLGLANSGFVFFFIEAAGAPFRKTRFAEDAEGAQGDPPARISIPIGESGLLSQGWIMLSDFAQREYPTLVVKPADQAAFASYLPTQRKKAEAVTQDGFTLPVRSFTQNVKALDPNEAVAFNDRFPNDAGRRQALTTVRSQALGDTGDEGSTGSWQQYGPNEDPEHRYADRMYQNVLVGRDIIPGLAERAVVEISRIGKVNQPLLQKIIKMKGAELLKFLLKDLLRPQAMVPNSVPITANQIQGPDGASGSGV